VSIGTSFLLLLCFVSLSLSLSFSRFQLFLFLWAKDLQLHPHQSCVQHSISFFFAALKRALPVSGHPIPLALESDTDERPALQVYLPIHGAYTLIVLLRNRGRNLSGSLRRFLANVLYSTSFLATYCTIAYMTLCILVRLLLLLLMLLLLIIWLQICSSSQFRIFRIRTDLPLRIALSISGLAVVRFQLSPPRPEHNQEDCVLLNGRSSYWITNLVGWNSHCTACPERSSPLITNSFGKRNFCLQCQVASLSCFAWLRQ
jgi:uncharacterized integral membrane protein